MSITNRGPAPRVRVLRMSRFAVLSAALAGGGCGHTYEPYSQANWYAGGPRQTAAAVPIPVEMEDDGRPAQLAPRTDIAGGPDDPSQPWSPNYGSRSLAADIDRKWQAVIQRAPAQPPPPGRSAQNTWQTEVQPASDQVAMAGDE